MVTFGPFAPRAAAEGRRPAASASPRELETDVLVETLEHAAEGVAVLTLRDPAGGRLPGWSPGAHVDLVLPNGEFKQYSLCGIPGDRDSWRLGILLDPTGSGVSRYIHQDLKEGDVLRARGPRNHFQLLDAQDLLFIAGGIGITPILTMVQQAEAEGRRWKLVYGGRTRSSMAFLDELSRFGDHVTVWPQDERGLIEVEKLLSELSPEALAYCCGPQPLLDSVEEVAKTWAPGRLHVERFSGKPIDHSNDKPFEIRLALSGITLEVAADESILSVLKTAGVSTVSSCGEGTCGTCETIVLDGIPEHRDSVLDEDEREQGDSMMICVSRALSERLVLDI